MKLKQNNLVDLRLKFCSFYFRFILHVRAALVATLGYLTAEESTDSAIPLRHFWRDFLKAPEMSMHFEVLLLWCTAARAECQFLLVESMFWCAEGTRKETNTRMPRLLFEHYSVLRIFDYSDIRLHPYFQGRILAQVVKDSQPETMQTPGREGYWLKWSRLLDSQPEIMHTPGREGYWLKRSRIATRNNAHIIFTHLPNNS